ISRHIIVWHIHLRHNIWLVGQLTKELYSIYQKYRDNNIRLITEECMIVMFGVSKIVRIDGFRSDCKQTGTKFVTGFMVDKSAAPMNGEMRRPI
uniref:Uncharacterized protein n=1 Tax=Romanomermis culicivorax TaxID=13658 RepID=A0A915JY80_ROMCU